MNMHQKSWLSFQLASKDMNILASSWLCAWLNMCMSPPTTLKRHLCLPQLDWKWVRRPYLRNIRISSVPMLLSIRLPDEIMWMEVYCPIIAQFLNAYHRIGPITLSTSVIHVEKHENSSWKSWLKDFHRKLYHLAYANWHKLQLIKNCPKCNRELAESNFVKKDDNIHLVCECGFFSNDAKIFTR